MVTPHEDLDRVGGVSILCEDPTLARQIPPEEALVASRRAVANVVSLPKGIFWPDERFPNEPGALGMLLLDGILLRAVAVTDRPTVEVIGPGELFRPFEAARTSDAMVSGEVRWWALRPARVAVLDARFCRSISDYPGLIAELAGRLSRRPAASTLRLALAQEPRLSVRLHCMLWHLADRFGEAQDAGILLRVPLCHVLLSWLAGARRPAMSRAINELERAGHLVRNPDGTWWLGLEAPKGFGAVALRAPRVAA